MGDVHGMDGEQAQLWNGPAGRAWVELQAVLDGMLKPFGDMIVEAVPATGTGSVLDVGCGAGATTLEAARPLGAKGHCVGVDISEPLIAAARSRAERDGIPARFIHADAQTYGFEQASFDIIISQFGVMFFRGPHPSLCEPSARSQQGSGAPLRRVAERCGKSIHDDGRAGRGAAFAKYPGSPARCAGAVRLRRSKPGSRYTGEERLVRRRHPASRPCLQSPREELVGYFTRFQSAVFCKKWTNAPARASSQQFEPRSTPM